MNIPELATGADAQEVLALYRAATAAAKATGNSHWDENYPSEETIRADLAGDFLYIWREDGRIVAAITLMHPCDLDGRGIAWTSAERAVEACRFCLSPDVQGRGRAREYFLGAIEKLRELGVQSMRYLCAKDNPAAYRTYVVLGHRVVGETDWEGVDYYAFEVMI